MKRNINVKQLVLVKAPIEQGPDKIYRNLIRQIEDLRVRHTPREVALAFDISPEITQAVGAPRLPDLENLPIDQNPVDRPQRERRLPHRYRE